MRIEFLIYVVKWCLMLFMFVMILVFMFCGVWLNNVVFNCLCMLVNILLSLYKIKLFYKFFRTSTFALLMYFKISFWMFFKDLSLLSLGMFILSFCNILGWKNNFGIWNCSTSISMVFLFGNSYVTFVIFLCLFELNVWLFSV